MSLQRVVFAVHDLGNLGGIQSSVDALAAEFSARGVSVGYISMNPPVAPVPIPGPVFVVNAGQQWTSDHPLAAQYPGPGGMVLLAKRLTVRPWRRIRRARLRRKLHGWGPETAVIFAEPEIPDVLLHAGEPLRRPGTAGPTLISQVHTSFEGSRAWKLDEVLTRVITGTDAFVALSRGDAQMFANRHGRPVAVIGNTVAEAPGGEADRLPVAVYLGRLAHEKRLDLLLRAFDLAADEVPEWELHLHGSGVLEDDLRSQVQGMAHRDRVRLMGPTRSPHEVWQSASLAVLSSAFEGQPMMLLEAAAHGVPNVVTLTSPAVADIVAVCGIGVSKDPSDEEFAQALVRAMADDSWRERAGGAARRAMQAHEPSAIVGDWLTLIEARDAQAVTHVDPSEMTKAGSRP